MKQKRILKTFAVCYFILLTATAQEKLDCDFNFREALFFLKGDKNFKRDSLKSIEFLKPCLKIGDAKAQLLMGRLYAAKKNKNNYRKAFKLIKKSAKQGNAIATADLGIMYKYGRGCNLNLNKARKWFRKGAALGNDKATYALGYLYLKGFGNITQDYSKAVKWFEKSKYPMANYWLGICYYYGYGVQKDIIKANELLGANFENAVSLNQNNSSNKNSSSEFSEQLESGNKESNNFLDITEENLYGKWSGKLLKFDWSGKNIEQKHDFTLEIKYDSINESAVYSLKINEQKLEKKVINRVDNEMYFDDLYINLPHTSFSEKIPNNLDYQFLSTNLRIKTIGEFTFLTGNIESYINSWNESGAPLKFVLKKKETFANSDEELSDEILDALSSQEDNFIKLYPNPFKTDLIISYTLNTLSFVEVRITDIKGHKNSIVEKGREQKAGKHSYYFNGSNLQKGIYVVTVYVNNEKKTRLIIKK